MEDSLDELLFNYRSTSHASTGISPHEAMYGRKMRTMLSQYSPLREEGEGRINREKYNDNLIKMKEQYDERHRTKELQIRVGDFVHTKRENGTYQVPIRVIDVMRTSVVTADGRRWPKNLAFVTRGLF